MQLFRTWRVLTAIVVLVAAFGGAVAPRLALAATVVGDGREVSCTESTLDAALAAGGEITFNCGSGPHTIHLTSQKTIGNGTTIDGGGKITLRGSGSHRLMHIESGAVVRLVGLRLTNGYNASWGGAIESYGDLTIEDSLIWGNRTTGDGGAIDSERGVLTIINSSISNNTAHSGGGIVSWSSTLTISGSEIVGNSAGIGGGIYIQGGQITISDSRIAGNSGTYGVGVYVNGSGSIVDTTISGNSGQTGAPVGIGVYNSTSGELTILRSTISGNTGDHPASTGGGISNGGELHVINSTVSGNRTAYGGGIDSLSGSTTVVSSTIAMNQATDGAGIYASSGTTLLNSILAGNTQSSTGNPLNCAAALAFISNGHNLSDDSTCAAQFTATGDINGLIADLEPLAYHGGRTATHKLGPASNAIDRGDAALCAADPVNNRDQRNVRRPIDGNRDGSAVCDIGAFEVGPRDITAPTTTVSLSSTPNEHGWHRQPVTVTLTADDGPGSGAESITYRAYGSQQIAETTVDGSTAEFQIDAQGETIIVFYATDRAGNVEQENATSVKVDSQAPVVSAPTIRIMHASSTLVFVSFWWSGNDSGSEIERYQFQRSVGGGPYRNLSLVTPNDITRELWLATEREYSFRVRAFDWAGNVSAWQTLDPFVVELHQESSSAMTYYGRWRQGALSGASGGRVAHTSIGGRWARLAFTGTSVALIGVYGPDRGVADPRIDGVDYSDITLYRPDVLTREVVFQADNLGTGQHRLFVTVTDDVPTGSTGSRVDIDAMVVIRPVE